MKNALNLILALSVLFTVNTSFAEGDTDKGGVDSGGGGALLCADGKTELLDLWEGEALYNLNITRSNEAVITQFNRAVEKLGSYDSALPAEITAIAHKLFSEKESLKAGMELEPPRDANTNYKKAGCTLTGMMFYDRLKQKLVIDEKHFGKLKSNTDIAAGMVHEAWYYVVRKNQSAKNPVKDSVNSRKLVACLFSDSTTCLQESIKTVSAKTFYSCKSETSEIEVAGLNGTYYFNILKIRGRSFKNVIAQMDPHGRILNINLADAANLKQAALVGFDLKVYSQMPQISMDSALETISIKNLVNEFKTDDVLDCEKR